MAKLLTMFILLMVMMLTMLLYTQGTEPAYGENPLYKFMFGFENWSATDFLVVFGAIAVALGLSGISSGSLLRIITDFPTMAAAIVGLLGIGLVFVNFSHLFGNSLLGFFPSCGTDQFNCDPIRYIKAATMGPLSFYYIWTVIEWWKNKDI